jgi:5-methylcytosine-specific restriction endonuclease McrA
MRREFTAKVKMLAYNRCLRDGKPHCEACGLRIMGVPEYDHEKPDGLGGEPTLENCAVLCGKCHRIKTHEEDRPIMAKADRQKKAAAGVKRKYKWPKRKMQRETV